MLAEFDLYSRGIMCIQIEMFGDLKFQLFGCRQIAKEDVDVVVVPDNNGLLSNHAFFVLQDQQFTR